LLSAAEAITDRSQLTLSSLAAAADDGDNDVTHSLFHTLEVGSAVSLLYALFATRPQDE